MSDDECNMLSHREFERDNGVGHEQRWEQMLSRLILYRQNHGHCLVPNRYPQDQKLGAWVATQRRQYKAMKAGCPTSMTRTRAQRLEQVGFVWSPKEVPYPQQDIVPWVDRLRELEIYFERYGTTEVLPRPPHLELANWVSEQRREHKLHKSGKTSSLTADRIRLLDELGFDWESKKPQTEVLSESDHDSDPESNEDDESATAKSKSKSRNMAKRYHGMEKDLANRKAQSRMELLELLQQPESCAVSKRERELSSLESTSKKRRKKQGLDFPYSMPMLSTMPGNSAMQEVALREAALQEATLQEAALQEAAYQEAILHKAALQQAVRRSSLPPTMEMSHLSGRGFDFGVPPVDPITAAALGSLPFDTPDTSLLRALGGGPYPRIPSPPLSGLPASLPPSLLPHSLSSMPGLPNINLDATTKAAKAAAVAAAEAQTAALQSNLFRQRRSSFQYM